MMGSFSIMHIVVAIALAAVAIVLFLGLWNMMRGGSPERSQKLMRLRVQLQLVAIGVVLVALFVFNS